MDWLPVYFHPAVRSAVDDFVGEQAPDVLRTPLDGSSLCSAHTAHGPLATRLRAASGGQAVRSGRGWGYSRRLIDKAKTIMRTWWGKFFPRANYTDEGRRNTFQMGTGTSGTRAKNLAKRALGEDAQLKEARRAHAANVKGSRKGKRKRVGRDRTPMVVVSDGEDDGTVV